jgi:NAD(P)H-quinone oxidoreductase subunit 5
LINSLLPLLILSPILLSLPVVQFGALRLGQIMYFAPLGLILIFAHQIYLGESLRWVFYAGESISMGYQLDKLSGVVGLTVMIIGTCCYHFSIRYMGDDPRQKEFLRNLVLMKTLVLSMIFSTNLLILWLSWLGVSFYLHRLLVHFKESDDAQFAAKQKFWVSRVGDIFIILSLACIFKVFGTFDFQSIALQLANIDFITAQNNMIAITSLLLVIGAMTKSAIVPFHFWLPNTLESPTPVSAIMHAGVINSGGYLIIKMSPMLVHAPNSLMLLAIVGAITVFYGSFIMLSQSNIKKNLAYSTIAQMGFMMLQCGLGFFWLAALHMVGHAFYKSYAFLNSGSYVEFGRLSRYHPQLRDSKNQVWTYVYPPLMTLLVLGLGYLLGYGLNKPGMPVLLVVLILAATQVMLSFGSLLNGVKTSISLVLLYFTLALFAQSFLATDFSDVSGHGLNHPPYILLIVSSVFITLFFVQNNLEAISRSSLGRWLYVKSLNGGLFGR